MFLKTIYILLLISMFTYCSKHKSSELMRIQTDIPEIKYEDLFKKITSNKETLYVVNFWATWCKPCVDELPDFMKVNNNFAKNPNFKLYLVSLDFIKNKNSLVIPFLKKNNINAEVLLMNDNKRMNSWIPLIDKTWSGSIPATVIYKNGEKIFFIEGKLTESELKKIIYKYL